MAELVADLEMLHYMTPNLRHEMYYWVRLSKNSLAEIDYLLPPHLNILPIEVKVGSQGRMKSLWAFMREKHITEAIRCSLENFGEFSYIDKEDADKDRHVSFFLYMLYRSIIKSTTTKPICWYSI